MKLGMILALVFSGTAYAAPSACVMYVENSGGTVDAQYSCDGGALQELFSADSITAAISQGIPNFVSQGYTFNQCTDSYSPGPNDTSGSAYSRCIFTKN